MLLLVVVATSIASATPLVAVVSDGTALDEANAAASHLSSTSKVTATAIDHVVTASCVRTTACAERPSADFILALTSTTGGAHIDLDLVDKTGVSVAHELVDVTDPALVDAALAPALDRIATAAQTHASNAATSASSSSPSGTGEGNAWLPWVLGIGGGCGLFLVATGGLCVLGSLSSPRTTTGGNTPAPQQQQPTFGDSLTKACAAPFTACGTLSTACTGVGDGLGNACGSVGNSCGSAGDGIGNACGSLGNIGSCAVMPAAALQQAAPRSPDERGQEYAPGSMRY